MASLLLTAGLVVGGGLSASVLADEPKALSDIAKQQPSPAAPKFVTQSLRGRVVWMAEAMKRRFGIESDADAAESQVALETTEGELLPIVKDSRGRGFWIDPRLRSMDYELVVRRYEHSPAVQIVRVYTIKQGRKYELDYWCDICAIPMYELKDCECCQGPTRLREQEVEKAAE